MVVYVDGILEEEGAFVENVLYCFLYRFFSSFSLPLSVIIFQVGSGKEGKERPHDDGMVGSSWVVSR